LLGGMLVRPGNRNEVRFVPGREQSKLYSGPQSSKRKPELQTELWVGPAKNWTAIEPPGPTRIVWNLNLSLLLTGYCERVLRRFIDDFVCFQPSLYYSRTMEFLQEFQRFQRIAEGINFRNER
jgi:hypothetical protein